MLSFTSVPNLPRRDIELLCMGELLIDVIASGYGELSACSRFERFAGGSPVNIASNARKLGVAAEVVAAVGADGWGDFLLDGLAAAGMDASLVQRRDDAATSLVVLTRSRGTPTPLFYRDADRRIEASPELARIAADSSILHLSCWPLSAEPARGSALAAAEAARASGALVCLDPNYHPMIWKDRREALETLEALMPSIDIVKPSEDDAERLFGPDAPERQIRRYLDLGAKVVVMTLGPEGAIASDGREKREYPSVAGEVIDVTGAGDAFWCGLYAGILRGRGLDESIRLGMRVAAVKLRGVGAEMPREALAELRQELGREGEPDRAASVSGAGSARWPS
jgi:sugar/nucleoside kinase (ribokinase family)